MKRSSCLSKSFMEVLHNKHALRCFIQFMQSQHAERFINFWLEVNSFQAVAVTPLSSQTVCSIKVIQGKKDQSLQCNESCPTESEKSKDSYVGVCMDRAEATYTVINNVDNFCDDEMCNACRNVCSLCVNSLALCENVSMSDSQDCEMCGKNVRSSFTKRSLLPLTFENRLRSASPSNEAQTASSDSRRDNPLSINETSYFSHDSDNDSSNGETVLTSNSHDDNVVCVSKVCAYQGELCLDLKDCVITGHLPHYGVVQHHCSTAAPPSILSKCGSGEFTNSADYANPLSAGTLLVHNTCDKLIKAVEGDVMKIFHKYLSHDAEFPIGIDQVLRENIVGKICQVDQQIQPDCFVNCLDFVVSLMERVYYEAFMNSKFYRQHQVALLVGSDVCLADILYNRHALCYFLEYMEQEHGQHLLRFWLAADNFEQQLLQQCVNCDGVEAGNIGIQSNDAFQTHSDDLQAHSDDLQAHSGDLQVHSCDKQAKINVLLVKCNGLQAGADIPQAHSDDLLSKSDDLQSKYDGEQFKSDDLQAQRDGLQAQSDSKETKNCDSQTQGDALQAYGVIQHAHRNNLQAQSDAIVIYEKFFSLQATESLGFDYAIRCEVENQICREGGPLAHCFQQPMDAVVSLMEKVYFPRYVSSGIYHRYLSELMRSVSVPDGGLCSRQKRHVSNTSSPPALQIHRARSDGLGSANTLLAAACHSLQSSRCHFVQRAHSPLQAPLMRMQPFGYHYAVDSIRIGTATGMGGFVPQFDSCPRTNKNKGGFFRRIWSKCGKDADKHLAMQTAQDILADVADMTRIGDACAGIDGRPSANYMTRPSLITRTQSFPSKWGSVGIFEPPPS